MKYLRQFSIICAISLIGVAIEKLLPFPFPGSVIGMVIMLILLMTGIIKIETIDETASFLLSNMAIMFLPSTATLVLHLDVLAKSWFPIVFISITTTVIAFAAAAFAIRITRKLMGAGKKADEKEEK